MTFAITNVVAARQRVLADLRVHFVKANGKTAAKVFKLKTFAFEPNETVRLRKTIALSEMTTRKHYAGTHRIELVLNGHVRSIGEFDLADRYGVETNS